MLYVFELLQCENILRLIEMTSNCFDVDKLLTLTTVHIEHWSPTTRHLTLLISSPNRATEPKCTFMLAKSHESAQRVLIAPVFLNYRVNSESVTHTQNGMLLCPPPRLLDAGDNKAKKRELTVSWKLNSSTTTNHNYAKTSILNTDVTLNEIQTFLIPKNIAN